jgi:EAL domain-containing protein (putative c-di-GMP-specific phosphodiesterase class I)
MAVNVAGRSLEDILFAPEVEHLLARHRLVARDLILDFAGGDLSRLQGYGPHLVKLRELGVRFAIDCIDGIDSEVPSVALITWLPADYVKLNTSRLRADPDRAKAVGEAVNFTRALGLQAVAMGVEHNDERESLRKMGFDLAQGYGFGRPASRRQTEALLERAAAQPNGPEM